MCSEHNGVSGQLGSTFTEQASVLYDVNTMIEFVFAKLLIM
jgi:hypothetical protein